MKSFFEQSLDWIVFGLASLLFLILLGYFIWQELGQTDQSLFQFDDAWLWIYDYLTSKISKATEPSG